jgi:hypothetical protein
MPKFPSANHLRGEGTSMAHWIYILWAVNALIGVATRRNATLAIVRLLCVLTKDPDRAVRCAEILRLARKDAKDLPSYLTPPPLVTEHSPGKRRVRHRPAQNKNTPQGSALDRIAG